MFIGCLTHPQRAFKSRRAQASHSLWGLTLEFSSLNYPFLKGLVQLNVRAVSLYLMHLNSFYKTYSDKVKLCLRIEAKAEQPLQRIQGLFFKIFKGTSSQKFEIQVISKSKVHMEAPVAEIHFSNPEVIFLIFMLC